MDKHLLLTVSDRGIAANTLRFVKYFFNDFCELRITLLYVASQAAYDYDPNLQPEQAELEAVRSATRSKGQGILDESWKWITSHACDPDRVTRKVLPARGNLAQEIVNEGHVGLYDAVILGHRGLTWIDELTRGSVSHAMLWQEIDFPIWICGRNVDTERSGVLLAVDGSEPSVRIADHVGYMLGAHQEQPITLCYVTDSKGPLSAKEEARIEHARIAILDNDVPEDHISTRILRSSKPAEALLAEAEKDRFAVVALGRRRDQPSRLQRLLGGSVSESLLKKLSDFTLWISK